MLLKPSHWNTDNAAVFQEPSIVERYHLRPPYPAKVFDVLASLVPDEPSTVLDIGCGPGDIARNLVTSVERVDAVDLSEPMIERGRQLPRGHHKNLSWIQGAVESAELAPPYGLITAGDSLHWMNWSNLFPRLCQVLAPNGKLAIVTRGWGTGTSEEIDIFARYSTVRDFKATSLVEELSRRRLFELEDQVKTKPVVWTPTIEEYIACRHSHSGFSLDRMNGQDATAFDSELRQLLLLLVDDGQIQMQEKRLQMEVRATIHWGRPLTPA